VVAVLTAYAVLLAPFVAEAQCKADVDCKGDRICEQGQCVDPRTKQPDAPPPPATPPPPAPPPPEKTEDDGVKVIIRDVGEPAVEDYSTGWALPAGIIGIISAAGVLGLSIGSAVTLEDDFGFREVVPAVPLGVSAFVLTAAVAPIVFVGGGSARRGAGATGSLGLRIGGWVAYGVALLAGLYILLFNVADIIEAPEWLIIADGVVGALALVMFSADAFISHAEASQGAISQGPAILPTLVWAKTNDGGSLPTVGLRARF
jgi:hypothetical protein